VIDRGMLGTNPPDHTRLRRIAQPGFSPRLMRAYENTIEKRVGVLLDGVATKDRFDLVHEVAAPLPIAVITDLLGLPDADTAAFERYGQAMASSLDGIKSLSHAVRLAVGAARLEASSGSSPCASRSPARSWSPRW